MQKLKNSLSLCLIGLILFSFGCGAFRSREAFVYGPEDYLLLPKGTKLVGVPIKIGREEKVFDIELEKEGAFYSTDAAKDLFEAKHR